MALGMEGPEAWRGGGILLLAFHCGWLLPPWELVCLHFSRPSQPLSPCIRRRGQDSTGEGWFLGVYVCVQWGTWNL